MAQRRPIATRDRKWAQRIAAWLARHEVTPNRISQASILFAAVAGAAFWLSGGASAPWLIVAALGVQGRLLCNLFDGMVAVEGGRAEPDGPFWNEAPDRYADILILVGMGLGAAMPALGWAAATMAVLAAYTREAGAAQGLEPDFSGPMAKQHRMALTTLGAVLGIFIPILMGQPTLALVLWVIILGAAFTALRRGQKMVADLNSSRDQS
ncbi:CDP-alcohol phosphatidyltransferase family protein [Aliiroseovarius sediminis]|uniref:CDP-alcohol phosphatidyltransferase family protein n=1 Tax=Aliiroseovarius sediminis TaxID=2925839 RepID=UPI001F5A6ABB|nr:CDP-alcohol phosphatidyltransferase family protein [Aliiroseovarius sediminis]MCI2395470.1 CDP-alcohol phosphatidyltransferase family protein [Aliiroseovarius sediminis]